MEAIDYIKKYGVDSSFAEKLVEKDDIFLNEFSKLVEKGLAEMAYRKKLKKIVDRENKI